jgi:hypothetical protein
MNLISDIGRLIDRISFIFPILAMLSLLLWVFGRDRYVKGARRKIKRIFRKSLITGRVPGDQKEDFNRRKTEDSDKI